MGNKNNQNKKITQIFKKKIVDYIYYGFPYCNKWVT